MTPVILVATDGTDSALGALRTAYLLSLRDGTPVEVLAVCPPTEIYGAGSAEAAAGFPARLLATSVAVLTERVQEQLTRSTRTPRMADRGRGGCRRSDGRPARGAPRGRSHRAGPGNSPPDREVAGA
jgi:hypothetical protein